jgi:hypothetical protein
VLTRQRNKPSSNSLRTTLLKCHLSLSSRTFRSLAALRRTPCLRQELKALCRNLNTTLLPCSLLSTSLPRICQHSPWQLRPTSTHRRSKVTHLSRPSRPRRSTETTLAGLTPWPTTLRRKRPMVLLAHLYSVLSDYAPGAFRAPISQAFEPKRECDNLPPRVTSTDRSVRHFHRRCHGEVKTALDKPSFSTRQIGL